MPRKACFVPQLNTAFDCTQSHLISTRRVFGALRRNASHHRHTAGGVHAHRRSDLPPTGLTMIEVLVSISIVGLLIAVLVPGVQSVRESARKVACKSNLSQVIVAFANFESLHGHLPGKHHDSRYYRKIGPFIELAEDQKHFPLLGCPSDPIAEGEVSSYHVTYKLNNGVYGDDKAGDGIFGSSRKHIRLSDVTDGVSQTAALSEMFALPSGGRVYDYSSNHPSFANWYYDFIENPSTDVNAIGEDCELRPEGRSPFVVTTITYTHVLPPNGNSCFNFAMEVMSEPTHFKSFAAAASHHPGGVHVAFLDGAVRFVSDSISIETWRAIGTRNGGEVISF